ncbi:MAG: hypothetical protein K9M99_02725 [Candidatus Cloacimonetes bacterium]|nr:hypothetical protein [Candidatus Cloacimonadota bacterium]
MESQKAVEEISFIKKIVEENRKVSYPNGIYFIIWGIAVFLGMLGNFYLVKEGLGRKILWLWLGIVLVGWVFTVISSRKEDRKAGYSDWTGKVYGYLWMAAGVCMSIIGFTGPFSRVLNPMAICPLIGLIMGMAHFISGMMNDFKWQQIVGVLWWIGSIVLFFWVAVENFLVFGVMMLLLHALPGFILNGYYKRQ